MTKARDLANNAEGTKPKVVDAKGDLIVGTGADAAAALTVASTAGYVLTVDSGEATGLKWAAAGSGFVGVSLVKEFQSANNNTNTVLTWDSEFFDTDGFHDNVTNNSRITIPTGKGGKYLIVLKIDIAATTSGENLAWLTVNGGTIMRVRQPRNTNLNPQSIAMTVVRDLSAGDYIQANIFQDSGSFRTMDVTGTNDYWHHFTATYLGA